MHTHPYRHLFTLNSARSRRASSWDRTGGNADFINILPGSTATLADIQGPGCITHIYCTMINADPLDYRDAVLRMYWDGEDAPSVEVPLGDFFGAAQCRMGSLTSLLLTINPGNPGSYGLNSYFPMPFADGAKITLEHQGPRRLGGVLGAFWYHIDYEVYDEPPGNDVGRFHAQWRRENLTRSADSEHTNAQLWSGKNPSDAENYVILEAAGHGQVVGLHLQIDNVAGGWYGEGDDMIVIDGEPWPPALHGTGTEEIFGAGASPDRAYDGPYTGYHLIENKDGRAWAGNNAMYRWYIHDPVRFAKSIRMSIEHGHANNFENDYTSVAYWYQTEPHAPFPDLPEYTVRHPHRPDGFDELREDLVQAMLRLFRRAGRTAPEDMARHMRALGEAYDALYQGDVAGGRRLLASMATTERNS